ncbi:Protein of unknown function (DUF3405) domain containing protein [Elaphomyces granulatus]
MARHTKDSTLSELRPSSRKYSHDRDLEKSDSIPYDSGEDDLPSDCSRVTSGSHQPMLGAPSRRRRRTRLPFYRMPHRLMRWLCLALFSALLLFVINLFRFTLVTPMEQAPLALPKPIAQPPLWESFPFLKRYHGGLRTLVPRNDSIPEYPTEEIDDTSDVEATNRTLSRRDQQVAEILSTAFNPYPDYRSEAYINQYGEKNDCFLDGEGSTRLPAVHYYKGVPRGFPEAIMGSNEMIGIQDDICFDRFGRLGPYGLGYGVKKGGSGAGLEGHRDGMERIWEDIPPVDFREIDWAAAQNRCATANRHRFHDLPPHPRLDLALAMPVGVADRPQFIEESHTKSKKAPKKGKDRLPRTAVIIRTWSDYNYTPEDILYLRSLISELSLLSGGEYTVHFLIHVKDDNLQIWADNETYERTLENALPAEFRGLATLWSERQMNLIYGGLEESFVRDLPVHGVYRSTFMPVQYFAYLHPEYDYFWHWEMDMRYTGHWYHLFDKASSWAREQPRKGLWERNARFYVPSVHGPWEDFKHLVRVQTEMGTNSPNNMWVPLKLKGDASDQNNGEAAGRQGDKFIWGPERPHESDIFEVDGEGNPPTTMEKDKYEWGVGEDADLIVFNPLFDPEGTTWVLKDDVTGYNKSNGQPPRRVAIIAASRLSRKLLMTMHRETTIKRHTMFSEMWPATTALHHGFKAVYVPHSVYIDRRWPPRYLESVFNAGRNGASGGARTAVFGDREHNFRGTTWFYSAGFSPNLWRRWLGYRVDNDGGEEEELADEGRMCLPPMLIHPIKDVEMIIDDGGQG